jgi:2-deoxy-D-gluconate 3-dehydrogenase
MISPYQSFDLTGRIALVTGGAGLLGSEFCKTLAAAGARVVVADIDRGAATDLAASINERGEWTNAVPGPGQAHAVQVDVSSRDSVREMVAFVLAEFGRLDILVNSAALDPKVKPKSLDAGWSSENLAGGKEKSGDKHPKPEDALTYSFEDYPLELWHTSLEVNLTGTFLCCQAAARPMSAQGKGVIINICSIYGLVGPDQRIYQRLGERAQYKPVDYSVTKAGVLGLTRYLAAYYAGKGIRVNALTPGGVFVDQDELFVQAYAARTILGRMAEKDELNGALLFLASDASNYMTGANLVVDGGWTAW